MKYYLIVGEASGELHASRLMAALKKKDPEAQFRFIGGDLMQTVGGERVRHYREMAYMGFVPVLLHLRVIFRNMAMVKRDIVDWQPDVVILVDYAGFNLNIAHFLRQHTDIPAFYYISPKIWAWKEWRIKNIRRDVSEMFCILPFEVDFYEKKHHYPVHYVGNPTADEVRQFRASYDGNLDIPDDNGKPLIALLAGSRLQEIKDNLPSMIEATSHLAGQYQMVLAGAPGVSPSYYDSFIKGTHVRIVYGKTYPLLSHAVAALVTSGTATLETALFGVPQVVCYRMAFPKLVAILRRILLKVKYVSLVNLIADAEVVSELVADSFSTDNIRRELEAILPGGPDREQMLKGYEEVSRRLGTSVAPENAAALIVSNLTQHFCNNIVSKS